MAQSKVLSIRFSDDEYKALQALSLIVGRPINTLVREAVNDMADRAATDDDVARQAAEARQRFEDANRQLKARIQRAAVESAESLGQPV